MNDQADTDRTAARLRAALSSAANVMVVHDAPETAPSRQPIDRARQRAPRNWGRLAPLAAAAGIVVIAAGTVIGTHLADSTGTHAGTGSGTAASTNQTTTGATAQTPKPEFYLTVTYPASGQNVLQFQVRRTNGGTVTSTKTISGANVGWGGYLASAAGDRSFYFAHYVCSTTVVPDTTFDRITITNAGRISGFAPAGPPVKGMVTAFAVSPGGSQVAYNALPGVCAGGGFRLTGVSSVSVEDLSTGAVRTWQDTTAQTAVGAAQPAVGRVSWTPDGHTVVLDEAGRGPDRLDLTVFALDPSSSGGSLQAHSRTLLKQNANCSTCVTTALAGPDGRLIELESQGTGQQTRMQVVSVPTKAGSPATVLYAGPRGAPSNAAENTELITDASGTWSLLWPSGSLSGPNQEFSPVGWIGNGQLHPLTGLARIFPQGIAW